MTALMISLTSGSLLAAFTLLLLIESKRGHRVVLTRFRAWLDRLVVRGYAFFAQLRVHAGSGTMRIFFHQTIQKFLTYLLHIIATIALYLEDMRKRNRTIVRAAKASREKNHLDLIAEHKIAYELTSEERTARKQRAIEGE